MKFPCKGMTDKERLMAVTDNTMAYSVSAPRHLLTDHCKLCQYYQYCLSNAVEKHNEKENKS